jgi:hypothetical protein
MAPIERHGLGWWEMAVGLAVALCWLGVSGVALVR